jgi:hypothetical protein
MTASHPPRLATWLLKRFLSDAQHESLIGDLVEEYRGGRSSLWYWRQVLIAIVVSTYREISAHKSLAIRALAVTFLVYHFLWLVVVRTALDEIQRAVFWMFAGPRGLPGWPPYYDDFHRVLLTLAGVATGWIVANLHREHRAAMVLLCGAALPFLELPLLIADSLHYQTNLSDVIAMVTFTIMGMVGILIGGLLGKSGEPAQPEIA